MQKYSFCSNRSTNIESRISEIDLTLFVWFCFLFCFLFVFKTLTRTTRTKSFSSVTLLSVSQWHSGKFIYICSSLTRMQKIVARICSKCSCTAGSKVSGTWILTNSCMKTNLCRRLSYSSWYVIRTGSTLTGVTRWVCRSPVFETRKPDEVGGGPKCCWTAQQLFVTGVVTNIPALKKPPKELSSQRD